MKSPKRSKVADAFDVTEFLRPDDQDLRSALSSLMGSSLMGSGTLGTPAENPTPPVNLGPPPDLTPPPVLAPGPSLGPGPELEPPPEFTPAPPGSAPGPNSAPPPSLGPPPNLGPGPDLTPTPRQYPLRRALSAEEGHSRGEQTVYETLWRLGQDQPDGSRLLQIGMLGLARRAGLSESNTRVNLRGLIQKLAIEEQTAYVCEAGQGRTWRVFSPDQILARRRSAGMEWYRRRTLAVVFEAPPREGQ